MTSNYHPHQTYLKINACLLGVVVSLVVFVLALAFVVAVRLLAALLVVSAVLYGAVEVAGLKGIRPVAL